VPTPANTMTFGSFLTTVPFAFVEPFAYSTSNQVV
jgi:hypothetical protein